ncbi:MAG: hypothetical protein ACRENP_04140 [Longimicrobiales bacterium]
MSETPAHAISATEAWLRDAFDHVLHELSLFGRTFAAFAVQPGSSAGAWQTGERSFMNPLGFGATAAGVYWTVASVLAALWPIAGAQMDNSIADQLTSAVGPYVHYGLLGVTMHCALRGLGSRRRILGSIGIAFFAGGSVGTVTALLLTGATRWFGHRRGTSFLQLSSGDLVPLALLVAGVLFYALVCLVLARALMRLHGVVGWKAVLAAGFAMVVTALLFGNLLPEGSYGWRPYIRIGLEDGFDVSFGFHG